MARTDRSVGTAAAGREERFNRLLSRPALDAAYRYATILLGNPSDAEDAVHDAALAAWRHLGDLRDEARFDAWFGRIVVNACRDVGRHRGPVSRPLDDEQSMPESSRPRAADPADALARRELLADAIRALSPAHREAIVLRYYVDLSVDQIATRTGTNAGTVKSRLHHALRQLRASVDAEYEERAEA